MKLFFMLLMLLGYRGVFAQGNEDISSLRKQLFEMNEAFMEMKSQVVALRQLAGDPGISVKGDAIRLLSAYIDKIDKQRKRDSVFFQQEIMDLQSKTLKQDPNVFFNAYQSMDSIRTVEQKMLSK